MRSRKCSQLWLVEAVRDGRVKDDRAATFQRHVKTCRDCQEETAILAQLQDDLRALPTRQPDPLSSRRHKHRLLATADAATVGTASQGRRGFAIAIAIIMAATLAVVLVVRARGKLNTATATADETSIKVSADPEARWDTTSAQGLRRVELMEGSFLLTITRRHLASRVIIGLPDGEIEDLGTVLSVKIEQGRTRAVAVTEGAVAVRLRGSPELRLSAGDSWHAPSTAPTSMDSDIKPPAVSPLGANRSLGVIAEPRKHLKSDTGQHAAAASSRVPAGSANGAAPETRAARAAEDKAYLDVLQLLRAGKESEARDAAGEYLLSFPNGFRRVEMLGVAKGGSRQP